jgi:phosphoribosylaminoimidazolecarboxamide formyltransferase/IMP cyclohydrolase
MMMNKRALLSVYDKSGIEGLAGFLSGKGWEILSTGGTARYARERGVPVTDIAEITGFPECLDGRVKTLHPAVHAGLLARRDENAHMETLEKLGLGTIDLVCVNLYPFFEKVRAGLSLEETVEFIDIGGPAMLRAAAKNYRGVIVLTDPADYGEVMKGLDEGIIPEHARKRLAGKAFDLTSAYDAAIARYLLELDKPGGEGNASGGGGGDPYPAYWPLPLKKAQPLRYGENRHQRAALYLNAGSPGALDGMEQLNGKELGYNNIRDLDLAWKAACAFGFPPEGKPPFGEDDLARCGVAGKEFRGDPKAKVPPGLPPPCCVAVKHNTPCGFALGATMREAYEKTFACDPVSIYGGILASTVKVDAVTASEIAELFLEIIVAPDYEDEALEILRRKKNLRVMKASRAPGDRTECAAVDGGLLVQETDRRFLDKWEVVTRTRPDSADIADMIFGMRAAAFVKSNAIVVVKDCAAIGIGGGQTNRIWAAEQALSRADAVVVAAEKNPVFAGTPMGDGNSARVMASDAFLPFADVVETAAAEGIKAIIQPGGSIRDQESIKACDRCGMAMVFTGARHFKH